MSGETNELSWIRIPSSAPGMIRYAYDGGAPHQPMHFHQEHGFQAYNYRNEPSPVPYPYYRPYYPEGFNRQKKKRETVCVVTVLATVSVIFCLFLASIFMSSTTQATSTSKSPEIFFHVDEPLTTDVTVEIAGGVTATVPEIPLGKTVTWKDVTVMPDGSVRYNGAIYPFLYYEGDFRYPDSNFGWVIEQRAGLLYYNDQPIDEEWLRLFLGAKLDQAGLSRYEVDYMMERVENNHMLDFSSKYLLIRYIPMDDVNRAMTLRFSQDFAVMRRHFLIETLDHPLEVQEPVFETVPYHGNLVHETAINCR